MFTATKDGSTSRVILIVEYRKADTEAKKVATLKGHWNAQVDSLKSRKYTDLKGKRPSFDSPVPDQVPFNISAKDPSGKIAAFQFVTAFGKNIYLFQATADSEEDAAKLIKVADSLKE